MRKKQPTNLIDRIDQIFSKKRTGKDKRVFIIIGAVVGMFLMYTLFLSPYAQCVSGYVKHEYREQGYKTKSEIKARAKMQCKALGRY